MTLVQCVIVATRPLLLSLLKERLDKLEQGEGDWQGFLNLTKPLISTSIKSAIKTLQVLSNEDGLLGNVPTTKSPPPPVSSSKIPRRPLTRNAELFLPFDLEFTYGAAIHVAMANALFPHLDDCHTYYQRAHTILDEMVSKGNKVAEMRKLELVHLERLFGELSKRVERSGLQTLGLTTPPEDGQPGAGCEDGGGCEGEGTPGVGGALPTPGDTELGSDLQPGIISNEFLDDLGISSYDFLSIVDQMGESDGYSNAMDVSH